MLAASGTSSGEDETSLLLDFFSDFRGTLPPGTLPDAPKKLAAEIPRALRIVVLRQ